MKRKSIRRAADIVVHATFILVAALALGFLIFCQSAVRARPTDDGSAADGIVALTGDGGGRVAEGLKLLEAGRGARLLISGVNPKATDQELAKVYSAPPALFSCCVDVGRLAEDTIGNAAETADWARAHGYTRLIVVTADFHLARSMAEIRLAMPEAELIGHPVAAAQKPPIWWRNPRTLRRLAIEYVKYLATMARTAAAWLDPFDGGRG